jgi:hypothetical protein
MSREKADLLPCKVPATVPRAPFEADRPVLGFTEQPFCFGTRVRRLARADVTHIDAQHFVARVTVTRAALRIDVDDRTAVPIVDEDRILALIENRAITCLRLAQRFFGTATLDLGGRPAGEDLQDRFA